MRSRKTGSEAVVLGLSTMGESGAALIAGGELVAAVEEERFTRHKHEGCFPLRSVAYCLEAAGLDYGAVDHVGVAWQPWRVGRRIGTLAGELLRDPRVLRSKLGHILSELSLAEGGSSAAEGQAGEGSWLELLVTERLLRDAFGAGPRPPRVHYLDHHRCHLATAFYSSPFDAATLLTFDGAGEDATTVIARGQGRAIEVLHEVPWPHSLGHFYAVVTGFLGFRMLDGEYKVMGLAPFGEPRYRDFFRERYLTGGAGGRFELDTSVADFHEAFEGRFGAPLREALGPPRLPSEPLAPRHRDIAASAQAAFEEVACELASWAFEAAGRHPNLGLAGGCALNCTANGRLLREGPFDAVFVPPAPHDAGTAVGAAQLVWHERLGQPRMAPMAHAYLGPAFDDTQIDAALAEADLDAERFEDDAALAIRCAGHLAEGKLLAWFQGRMELGPRALGARSILADPRNPNARDHINTKVKQREGFRPFAPSVKQESCADWFDLEQPVPFMNVTAAVRPERRGQIPAVTHVDGSARVHTVEEAAAPTYWTLLDAFERRTSVPILLNTSFNVQEPIVCTPAEAIRTFLASGIEALAIGRRLVPRPAEP